MAQRGSGRQEEIVRTLGGEVVSMGSCNSNFEFDGALALFASREASAGSKLGSL